MAHVKGHAKQKKSSKDDEDKFIDKVMRAAVEFAVPVSPTFSENVSKIMSRQYHKAKTKSKKLYDKVGKAGGGTVYRKRNYASGGRVAKYKD